MEYCSNSAEETEALGAELAVRLRPGDVVAYTGDLGAGKTAFTRGIARGLGIPEGVTSPTYTGWATLRSCSTSAGRTTWPGAACAPWSGARTWPTPWRTSPSGWTSAGGSTTDSA